MSAGYPFTGLSRTCTAHTWQWIVTLGCLGFRITRVVVTHFDGEVNPPLFLFFLWLQVAKCMKVIIGVMIRRVTFRWWSRVITILPVLEEAVKVERRGYNLMRESIMAGVSWMKLRSTPLRSDISARLKKLGRGFTYYTALHSLVSISSIKRAAKLGVKISPCFLALIFFKT